MASDFDASEFVDDDFQRARKSPASAGAPNPFNAAPGSVSEKAPTREQVDGKVSDMQQKLAELKRAQQELERERAGLEELRRRQLEFTTGRDEMTQQLTRGVSLLEEAEFSSRRNAEQMAKELAELKEALDKIQSVREETWTKEDLNVELTRALTIIENARMEWNGARLKFPLLDGALESKPEAGTNPETPLANVLQQPAYAQLCKIGLALTWPLALVTFLALATLLILLLKRVG